MRAMRAFRFDSLEGFSAEPTTPWTLWEDDTETLKENANKIPTSRKIFSYPSSRLNLRVS